MKPTCAGTLLRERSISDRTARRGSGTGTTAWLACPPCDPARVSAVNNVERPLNGSPTRPMSFIGRGAYPNAQGRSLWRPAPGCSDPTLGRPRLGLGLPEDLGDLVDPVEQLLPLLGILRLLGR